VNHPNAPAAETPRPRTDYANITEARPAESAEPDEIALAVAALQKNWIDVVAKGNYPDHDQGNFVEGAIRGLYQLLTKADFHEPNPVAERIMARKYDAYWMMVKSGMGQKSAWGKSDQLAARDVWDAIVEAERPGGIREVTDEDLNELRVEIIPEFCAVGERTILFGDGEAYKSWLALAATLSVATDAELVAGWKPALTGPVVYLDFEDNALEIRRRAKRLLRGATIPANFHVIGVAGGIARNLEELRDELGRIAPILIVCDSVRAANAARRSQQEDAWAFYGDLIMLSPSLSTAWILIAHVPKDKNNRDKPIGDSGWSNGARIAIRANRNNDDGHQALVGLDWTKMSNAPRPVDKTLTVNFGADGFVTLGLGIGEDQPTRVRNVFRDIYAITGNPVTKKAALDRCNERDPKIGLNRFGDILQTLRTQGVLNQTGAGARTAYIPVDMAADLALETA
jgi:hypothetical protein